MKGSVETLCSSKRHSPERSVVTARHPGLPLHYSGSSSSMGSSSGLEDKKTRIKHFLQTSCILPRGYAFHADNLPTTVDLGLPLCTRPSVTYKYSLLLNFHTFEDLFPLHQVVGTNQDVNILHEKQVASSESPEVWRPLPLVHGVGVRHGERGHGADGLGFLRVTSFSLQQGKSEPRRVALHRAPVLT